MLKLRVSGGENLKRFAALALAVMMAVGAAGCFESGSGNDSSDVPGKLSNSSLGVGYSGIEKRMIKTLEGTCSAKEMSPGNKQKFIQDSDENFDKCFDGSVYVTLTPEDILSIYRIDDIDRSISPDNVENMFMFRKTEKKKYIDVRVYELSDEKFAQKAFISMEDSLEEEQDQFGDEMVKFKENDTNLTYMYDFYGITAYGYYEINGKTITSVAFFGNSEDDLYDEFCDFLGKMKYTDMVDFMDEVD